MIIHICIHIYIYIEPLSGFPSCHEGMEHDGTMFTALEATSPGTELLIVEYICSGSTCIFS